MLLMVQTQNQLCIPTSDLVYFEILQHTLLFPSEVLLGWSPLPTSVFPQQLLLFCFINYFLKFLNFKGGKEPNIQSAPP